MLINSLACFMGAAVAVGAGPAEPALAGTDAAKQASRTNADAEERVSRLVVKFIKAKRMLFINRCDRMYQSHNTNDENEQ